MKHGWKGVIRLRVEAETMTLYAVTDSMGERSHTNGAGKTSTKRRHYFFAAS